MNRDSLNIIKENYLDFFTYTMKMRTYPSVFDGLKLAQRRCLYAAFKKLPAGKMSKLTSHTGMTMTIHPHAEATETIIKMAGAFQTAFPLYDTQGEFGSPFDAHAAPRYLECRLNDTARKLYFSLIDQAPFENFEVEEEPLYLPTLFPLALLQGCFSVGQGTPNPLIPDLQFEDLKKFVMNYIKTGEKFVTKQNFVRLVDYDKVRDDKDKDDSICRLLNTGKGSIYFAPKIELKGNTITISNLYILAQFSSLLDRFKDDIQADKIDIRDESSDERVWVIEKVKNKQFDMEECAKIVKSKFTYKENFCMYFHDEEGRVKPYSLGEVIEACYGKYKEAYEKKLELEYNELCEQKSVLVCLAEMAEHTDIVTDNTLSDNDKIKMLSKEIDFPDFIIEKALQKPIRYLKNDEKAISKAEKDIQTNLNKSKSISKTILADVDKI